MNRENILLLYIPVIILPFLWGCESYDFDDIFSVFSPGRHQKRSIFSRSPENDSMNGTKDSRNGVVIGPRKAG